MPPAPGLFSTITDCPKASLNGAITARANTSVEPPAGKESTATTGFLGQSVSGALIATLAKERDSKAPVINRLTEFI